jgi:hypothetical protein
MMTLLNKTRLSKALELAGSYLEDRGISVEVVGIGGSALLLLGFIERPTQDLDLIASVESGTYLKLDELPQVLRETRDAVAAQLELAPDWINTEPCDVMDHGLPDGFADRCIKQTYGSLTLHLASRFDQICLKLHAAADRGDPKGKHAHDLWALSPTGDELVTAARWAQTHDPSQGFRSVLLLVLTDFGVENADNQLSPSV